MTSEQSPEGIGAQLKYPVRWHGSLMVAGGTQGTELAICRIFAELGLADAEVRAGNQSRSGRYETWKMSATVPNYVLLRALFERLERLPGVRMLL